MQTSKNSWPEVTADNYYDLVMSRFYMGSTQFKRFLECEAATMAWLEGKYEYPKSQAFLEGQLGHAWNAGPAAYESFKLQHPEMFSSRGATKGEPKAAFKKVMNAIEAIKRQPLVMKALEGQKEVIFTAELFGLPWKVAIDSYKPEDGRFTDLKFLSKLYDKVWVKGEDDIPYYESHYEAYGYFLQLAIYAEVERLATDRYSRLEPFLAVAEKAEVPDVAIMSFNSAAETYEEFINRQLGFVQKKMERVKAVKTGEEEPHSCGKCAYCKSTKVITGTQHYSAFLPY